MAAGIVRAAVLSCRPGAALKVGEAGELLPLGVVFVRTAPLSTAIGQARSARTGGGGGAGVEGGGEETHSFRVGRQVGPANTKRY